MHTAFFLSLTISLSFHFREKFAIDSQNESLRVTGSERAMWLQLGVEISLMVDRQLLGIKGAGGLRERVWRHRSPKKKDTSALVSFLRKMEEERKERCARLCFLSQGLESQQSLVAALG